MASVLIALLILGSETIELDLAGWICLATESSPQMVIAESSEELAEASYLSARSSLLPSLSLSGNTGKTWSEQTSGGYESEGISASGGFSLSAPLLSSGGADWLTLRSASTGRQIAELESRATLLALQQSVASGYYRVVKGYSNLAVAEGAYEKSLVVQQRIEMLYNMGSATQTELLEALVQNTEARIAVMNRLTEYENARESLCVVAGVSFEFGYYIDLQSVPEPLDSTEIEALPTSVDMNPTLISADLAVQRAEIEVTAVSRTRLPSVSVNGSYMWNGTGDDPGSFSGTGAFSAGLSVSLPVFDGWLTESRNISARASVLCEQATFALKRSTIEAEMQNTLRELRTFTEALKLAEINFEYRSKMLEIANSRYQLGDLGLDELLEAQNNCTDAEYQLIASGIDCLESEVDFCVLSGLDVRSGDANE